MRWLYNWFHRYYGAIEHHLDAKLDRVVRERIATLDGVGEMTALDYGCGSGLLTLKLAPHFSSVTGRDPSSGMLKRARSRVSSLGVDAAFSEGSLLAVDEPDGSVDWVFVSFALHLFSPETATEILGNLLRVSRQGVIVVDHSRKRDWATALVERLEGSWYDRFIRMDFDEAARKAGGARFEETEIAECMVLTFHKDAEADVLQSSRFRQTHAAAR